MKIKVFILCFGCIFGAFLLLIYPSIVYGEDLVNVVADKGMFLMRCDIDPNHLLEACQTSRFVTKPKCGRFIVETPYTVGIIQCNTDYLKSFKGEETFFFNRLAFCFYFLVIAFGLLIFFQIFGQTSLRCYFLIQSSKTSE
jgi:hypothetical protein